MYFSLIRISSSCSSLTGNFCFFHFELYIMHFIYGKWERDRQMDKDWKGLDQLITHPDITEWGKMEKQKWNSTFRKKKHQALEIYYPLQLTFIEHLICGHHFKFVFHVISFNPKNNTLWLSLTFLNAIMNVNHTKEVVIYKILLLLL